MKKSNITLPISSFSLLACGGAMAQIVLGTDSADESQATLFDSTEPMGDGLLSPAGDMMNTGQLVGSDSV